MAVNIIHTILRGLSWGFIECEFVEFCLKPSRNDPIYKRVEKLLLGLVITRSDRGFPINNSKRIIIPAYLIALTFVNAVVEVGVLVMFVELA